MSTHTHPKTDQQHRPGSPTPASPTPKDTRTQTPEAEADTPSSNDEEDEESNLHVFRDSNGLPLRIMTEKAYQLSMQNRGSR